MTDKNVYMVVAVDKNHGIGKDGKMPWHLKKEIKFFKEITLKTDNPDKINMVVMGRKTWESIPKKFRPLVGRMNVILTRNTDYEIEGATTVGSFDEALELAEDNNIENIHIIGGGKVYESIINHPALTGIYLTKLKEEFDCDTFFPTIPKAFTEKDKLRTELDNGIKYNIYLLTKE